MADRCDTYPVGTEFEVVADDVVSHGFPLGSRVVIVEHDEDDHAHFGLVGGSTAWIDLRLCVDDDLRLVDQADAKNAGGVKLYIAGPMTGLPEFNFPAFNNAEAALVAAGHEPLNPARHGAGEPDMEWADYMRRDIPDVLAVDGLALLDGWERSRGAVLEVNIVATLGLTVKPLEAWLR